jgi:hypothetical protein
MAEAFGLADVEDHTGGILIEVNAREGRQRDGFFPEIHAGAIL